MHAFRINRCSWGDRRIQSANGYQCHACRLPITEEDKQSERYQKGVSCPRCYDKLSDAQKARFAERENQIRLARERGEAHLGMDAVAQMQARRDAKQQQREAARRAALKASKKSGDKR